MTADPLTVPCDGDDGCNAGVGAACVTWEPVEAPFATTGNHYRAVPCDPHPERVARAEAVAKSNARRIPRSTVADAERELLAARAAMPDAFDALVRILRAGAVSRGLDGYQLGDATALHHLRKGMIHALRAIAPVDKAGGEWPRETGEGGSGELHAAHAIARWMLAVQREVGR